MEEKREIWKKMFRKIFWIYLCISCIVGAVIHRVDYIASCFLEAMLTLRYSIFSRAYIVGMFDAIVAVCTAYNIIIIIELKSCSPRLWWHIPPNKNNSPAQNKRLKWGHTFSQTNTRDGGACRIGNGQWGHITTFTYSNHSKHYFREHPHSGR